MAPGMAPATLRDKPRRSKPAGTMPRPAAAPSTVTKTITTAALRVPRTRHRLISRLNTRTRQLNLTVQITCFPSRSGPGFDASLRLERPAPSHEVVFSTSARQARTSKMLAREDVVRTALDFLRLQGDALGAGAALHGGGAAGRTRAQDRKWREAVAYMRSAGGGRGDAITLLSDGEDADGGEVLSGQGVGVGVDVPVRWGREGMLDRCAELEGLVRSMPRFRYLDYEAEETPQGGQRGVYVVSFEGRMGKGWTVTARARGEVARSKDRAWQAAVDVLIRAIKALHGSEVSRVEDEGAVVIVGEAAEGWHGERVEVIDISSDD